ncbi:MAG: L-histidine N(alpha)-methyltransferase [Candidatus Aminicenantes bacterium]|nr:L-histidine N(alpha)-methyltransferase [Candidatus Aminicenantes bacterium]
MEEKEETNYEISHDDEMSSHKLLQKFAVDVLTGLSQPLKWLPTEYIYDETGSMLFQQITTLPEYYLTRCETEILERSKGELREIIDAREFNLVELGAGDGKKTKILLGDFLDHQLTFRYIPIDISQSALEESMANLSRELPGLTMQGLVAEYFNGLKRLARLNTRKNIVLFLGSNIGNFNPPRIGLFLSGLWHALNNRDYVMIGFDLKKDIKKMIAAYNDKQGVTARFNLNLLHRINNELGGRFDLERFRYYSTYDVVKGAMQSYLVSLKDQDVYIDELKRSFNFKAWEPVHTESSYKFHIGEIERIARENHFEIVSHFFDAEKNFVDSLWRVKKD